CFRHCGQRIAEMQNPPACSAGFAILLIGLRLFGGAPHLTRNFSLNGEALQTLESSVALPFPSIDRPRHALDCTNTEGGGEAGCRRRRRLTCRREQAAR